MSLAWVTGTIRAHATGALHSRTIDNKMATANRAKVRRCAPIDLILQHIAMHRKSAAITSFAAQGFACLAHNERRNHQGSDWIGPCDSKECAGCQPGQGND